MLRPKWKLGSFIQRYSFKFRALYSMIPTQSFGNIFDKIHCTYKPSQAKLGEL